MVGNHHFHPFANRDEHSWAFWISISTTKWATRGGGLSTNQKAGWVPGLFVFLIQPWAKLQKEMAKRMPGSAAYEGKPEKSLLSSLSLLKDGNVGVFRDSTGSTEFKSTAITRIKAGVEKEFWDQSLGNQELIQRSFDVFIDWTRSVELRALVTERKHEHARGALELLHQNASDATVFCRWEQIPREQI